MSISLVETLFSVAISAVKIGCGDFVSLETDEMVMRDFSFNVSVSMEYDLRGNANVVPLEVVFKTLEVMCLLCFMVISGTERLKCVSSKR